MVERLFHVKEAIEFTQINERLQTMQLYYRNHRDCSSERSFKDNIFALIKCLCWSEIHFRFWIAKSKYSRETMKDSTRISHDRSMIEIVAAMPPLGARFKERKREKKKKEF